MDGLAVKDFAYFFTGLVIGAFASLAVRAEYYPLEPSQSAAAPEAAPIPEPPPSVLPADDLKDGEMQVWRPGHWETYDRREDAPAPPEDDYPQPPEPYGTHPVIEPVPSDAIGIPRPSHGGPVSAYQILHVGDALEITAGDKVWRRESVDEPFWRVVPPKPDERRPNPVAVRPEPLPDEPAEASRMQHHPFYISSVPSNGLISITLGENSEWVSIPHARDVCRTLLQKTDGLD